MFHTCISYYHDLWCGCATNAFQKNIPNVGVILFIRTINGWSPDVAPTSRHKPLLSQLWAPKIRTNNRIRSLLCLTKWGAEKTQAINLESPACGPVPVPLGEADHCPPPQPMDWPWRNPPQLPVPSPTHQLFPCQAPPHVPTPTQFLPFSPYPLLLIPHHVQLSLNRHKLYSLSFMPLVCLLFAPLFPNCIRIHVIDCLYKLLHQRASQEQLSIVPSGMWHPLLILYCQSFTEILPDEFHIWDGYELYK